MIQPVDTKNFPVGSVKHLILEQVANQARVRGEPTAAVVQVSYQPEGAAEPAELALQGETLYFRGGAAARVALPPELALTIYEASGDLRVQDLAGPLNLETVHGDLRLKGLAARAQVGRIEGGLRADGIAELRLLDTCTGDLRAQDAGNLSIESVGGDVRLFAVHSVHLGRVRGDVWIEKATGSLEVAHAVGDVRLAEAGGFVTVQEVAGDLQATDLTGGLAAQAVSGDAELHCSFADGGDYSLVAAGDITLALSLAADLRMTVQAGGRIRSEIQLTPAPDGASTFTATLGRGTGHLVLRSGGDLRIVPADRESPLPGQARSWPTPAEEWTNFSGLGDYMRQPVHASTSAPDVTASGGKFSSDAGAADARTAPPSGAVGPDRLASTGLACQPNPAGVSDDEQMAILKMVEAGTITAEQADALFRALGGMP